MTALASRLGDLMRPRRVALVGASDKNAFSRNTFHNLDRYGALERVSLVNVRSATTHGVPTLRSCAELPPDTDLAYLMVPHAAVPDALREAAAAGVRSAVVLSSGYSEAGEAGRAAERELSELADSLGVTLLGPNMLGFVNYVDQLPVCSIPVPRRDPGPIALLSQSGASSAAMLDFADMTGMGLSYLVTLGNEAMVTAGHVIDYLVDDPATRSIALFIESIREPDSFRAAARRAAQHGKPIVALKVGRSELSARAAAAHTGALVGDDRVIDAVFADLGVIRVDTIEDMIITAGAAAHLGQLDRPGIGVVSISGGACDVIADLAQDQGLSLPALASETVANIESFLPHATVQNPLDVTGAAVAEQTIMTRAIEAVSADPSIGAVAVLNSVPWLDDGLPWNGERLGVAIGEGIAAAKVPAVWVNQILQPHAGYTRDLLGKVGVSYVIPGIRSAVTALQKIGWWSAALRRGESDASRIGNLVLPAPDDRRGRWSEAQARDMLARAGVPVAGSVLAHDADEAVCAAHEFGGPVAMKIVSPDILHKSDVGGVRLGVGGDDAVRRAFGDLIAAGQRVDGARIDGVLVSPMRSGGVELLVGVVRDPDWGLMLAVALGGVFVEVLGDSVLAPVPVSADRAREMVASLRGAAVLDGFRGSAPADLDALAEVIARISALADGLGESLVSLEINPLRVDGDTIEALDAVVEWC